LKYYRFTNPALRSANRSPSQPRADIGHQALVKIFTKLVTSINLRILKMRETAGARQFERAISACNSTLFSITPFLTIRQEKSKSQTGGTGTTESSAGAGWAV
jgi:hypothetical protein